MSFFFLWYKKVAKNEENIVEENSENDEEHDEENDEENGEENDENHKKCSKNSVFFTIRVSEFGTSIFGRLNGPNISRFA